MCFLTTHIGFCCIQCVVIVLHLVSWSDNPHQFPSSFNPYLSDPLTLLSLIHDSHNDFLPFVLPFPQHHCCITNLQRAESLPSHSHLSHITYPRCYKCVDSVTRCSSALLFQKILYPSQISVPVKDKLESSGRILPSKQSALLLLSVSMQFFKPFFGL